MRYLLLFLILLGVVYFVRRALTGGGAASQQPAPERAAEQVLPCAHCGVLAPLSEGLARGQNFYCSSEHADLGPRGG